jgi:hypothetical protein
MIACLFVVKLRPLVLWLQEDCLPLEPIRDVVVVVRFG